VLAVFVDLDGTLVDYDAAVREAVGRFVRVHPPWEGVHPGRLATAWLAERRGVALDGSVSLRTQRARRMVTVAQQFGVRCDFRVACDWSHEIANDSAALCRPFGDVHAFLQMVPQAGLITNGDKDFQRAKLEAASIAPDRFVPLIASMDVGVAKPSPSLYTLAAVKAGLPVSRCVMIGDSYESDVQPALAAGFARAALVHRSDHPCPGSCASLLDALASVSV
jgi:HAD superfamily hydrolase (TIGR01549 family)